MGDLITFPPKASAINGPAAGGYAVLIEIGLSIRGATPEDATKWADWILTDLGCRGYMIAPLPTVPPTTLPPAG